MESLALFGRIALATLLAYLLGFFRSSQDRSFGAGRRTFSLVGMGAAAFTALSWQKGELLGASISGIAAGIGFLGAGVLTSRVQESRAGGRLATAASLWAAASIGALVGTGRFLVATLSTGLAILVLVMEDLPGLKNLDPGKLQSWLDRRRNATSSGDGSSVDS